MTDKQKVSKKLIELKQQYKSGIANIRQAKKLCTNGKYFFEVTILSYWHGSGEKHITHKGKEGEDIAKVKKDAIAKFRRVNDRTDNEFQPPEIRVVFENGVSFEVK